MLSPQLRRKVHDLWSLFWSSGLSNPLVAIEQITYLLFIRQLEKLDRERVEAGKRSIYYPTEAEEEQIRKDAMLIADNEAEHTDESAFAMLRELKGYEKCRWSYIRQNPSFELLNDTVFPWLRSLEQRIGPAQNGNTTLGRISGRLSDAYFVLDPNKTETLKRSVSLIDQLFRQLDTRSVNSDIMGDIFEYLLEEVKESGKNGQFRTPRHVIRFMVELLNPKLGETVFDPACGSGGFLLNTLLHWRAEHTDRDVLRLEWDGSPHDVLPIWPDGQDLDFSTIFKGYDNDRTMVRIAWMNLLLHGLDSPEVHQLDALSKELDKRQSQGEAPLEVDNILANPPFTGTVDTDDLSENRGRFPPIGKEPAKKSELLFVWLMLDLLKIGGRCAVIVPDGVLFGGTNAHTALRRKLLFENTLEAVVSLPANIFQPYSGVKTSILLFRKDGVEVEAGADPRTEEVWFYEVSDEAYSLDQKRKALFGQDNDLWDGIEKFKAWTAYREAKADGADPAALDGLKAEATGKHYHQPHYWEERWRTVDDDCLKVFPEQAANQGHIIPLHELWPDDFPFDTRSDQGARQYDEVVLAKMRPIFIEAFQKLVTATVSEVYGSAKKPDEEKAAKAAEKNVRAVVNQLNKHVRDSGILDREYDQFGLNALKQVFKEASAQVADWSQAVPVEKPKKKPKAPDPDAVAEALKPHLKEFAKLDGYNVWRRSNTVERHSEGKLTTTPEGERKRVKTQLSWVVPVREWAVRETWGEDPETKETIDKPTHPEGSLDPAYLDWLRDTLKVFDTDGMVKDEHRERLDPDCLEALDLNLSAGRHKPFTFDAGEHQAPAELITELQAIHGDIQKRLGKLLEMVGGRA